jgi:hypothetical protein
VKKFRVHYKLVCEGSLDFEVESEDEAREALLNDYRALYEKSDFDDVDVVQIEEVQERSERVTPKGA